MASWSFLRRILNPSRKDNKIHCWSATAGIDTTGCSWHEGSRFYSDVGSPRVRPVRAWVPRVFMGRPMWALMVCGIWAGDDHSPKQKEKTSRQASFLLHLCTPMKSDGPGNCFLLSPGSKLTGACLASRLLWVSCLPRTAAAHSSFLVMKG